MSEKSTQPIPFFNCADFYSPKGAILCSPTVEPQKGLIGVLSPEYTPSMEWQGYIKQYRPIEYKSTSCINEKLTTLRRSLWWGSIQAYSANELSKPLLEPSDLENLFKSLGFLRDTGVTVSPSLVRTQGSGPRMNLRPMSAGLLLWLESSGASKEDE